MQTQCANVGRLRQTAAVITEWHPTPRATALQFVRPRRDKPEVQKMALQEMEFNFVYARTTLIYTSSSYTNHSEKNLFKKVVPYQ